MNASANLPRNCALCSAPTSSLSLETAEVYGDTPGGGRAFHHCGSCDVFFQWPRLSEEDEKAFYKGEFEKFMLGRNASGGFDWTGPESHVKSNLPQRERREAFLRPYYDKLKARGQGSVLEVGCSSGFMLEGLREKYGLDCFGVEPSGVFREYLNHKGMPVTSSLEELMKAQPGRKYDLIMHFFVLEHIREPAPFIAATLELLAPGGTLIVEIPNAQDPLRTLYQTAAFKKFYWSIAHPWYFTPKSFEFLLRDKCGLKEFEVVGDQRYDIGNHTRWLLEGKPGGQGRLAPVFDKEFDVHFKRCLVQSGHCDTLVAFIRRNP
jgi:SAM-dependent methyltransferase